MAGSALTLGWACKGRYSQGNPDVAAWQDQPCNGSSALATMGLAPLSILPTSSEQPGVVDDPQPSHHLLPPILTATTVQPMDLRLPVLLLHLAGA